MSRNVEQSRNTSTEGGTLGRVAVLGAGAVGGYYGARLAHVGEEVAFLTRTHFRHWRDGGIVVRSVDGDFHVRDAEVHEHPESLGPVDLVIIALKATANAQMPAMIAPMLGEKTRLLTLQNGLGNDDLLASRFGAERVLGGLCFTCINRDSDGVIHHLGQGHISVGEYRRPAGDAADAVVAALKRAGVSSRAEDSLEAVQWRKLVWNIPFNGLAISEGGLDTEALLGLPDGEAKVRALMREVLAVAAGLGHDFPDGLMDQQIEVTRTMGAYRPSSLIDYLDRRAVEVDAIWGEALKRARTLGVPVPALESLHQRLLERVHGGG